MICRGLAGATLQAQAPRGAAASEKITGQVVSPNVPTNNTHTITNTTNVQMTSLPK